MKRRGIIALAIAVLMCAALAACQKGNSANSAASARGGRGAGGPQAVPVGVATVKQRDFPVYLTGLGSVQAFNTVIVRTRVDGQIDESTPNGKRTQQQLEKDHGV